MLMQNRLIAIIILGIVLIIGISCDKDPIGYDELQRNIADATFIELRSTERECYGKYVPLGNSKYLMLGKNANYESRILLQFPLSDTLLDSVRAVKLVLYPNMHKAIRFKIHPIANEWKQSYATWIRMDENVPWDNPEGGGDFYQTILAETTLTSDSCIIELKRNKLDTLVNHAFGIILVPDTSVTDFATILAKEFGSKIPRIVYEFRNYTEVYYANQDCHIIDTTNLNLGLFGYWLGSGFVYRTLLRFPIKESIPSNVTIAYAELLVPISQAFSITDTVMVAVRRILDSLPLGVSTRFTDYISARDTFILSQDSMLVFDVRNIVQFWNQFNGLNNQPDSVFGLVLSGYPEESGLSRLSILTSGRGVRLKIGYLTPPPRRF